MPSLITKLRQQPAWIALIIFVLLCIWVASGMSQHQEATTSPASHAKPVPLEGVEQIKDIQDDLIDFWLNGASKGATIDIKGFDENASFVMKQYTLLLSAPGSGKSDFVDHICAKFTTKYGWKVGICSPENTPTKFHYDKIVRKILGYRPKENVFADNVSLCMDFIRLKGNKKSSFKKKRFKD